MKAAKALYIIAIFVVTGIIITFFAARRFGFFGNSVSPVTDKVTTNAFKSVEIDATIVNLSIKEGEEYAVEYTYPAELVPKIRMDGDKLKIESKTKKGFSLVSFNGVSFNGKQKGYNDIQTKLVIFVPKGTAFDEFEVKADAGNVNLKGYAFDKLNIQCDAANVQMDEVTAEKTTVNTDAGNIQIKDSRLGDTDLSADAGNVEVDDTGMGKLKVETGMGNVDIKDGAFSEGDLVSDLGRIAVDCTFDEVKAESDLGAISIDSDNIKNAVLDLEVSLGSITVDGKNVGKTYKQD